MTTASRLIAAGLALTALCLALALLPGNAAAAQCKGGDVSPGKLNDKRAAKAVLCLLNKERRRHHLKPLRRQRAQTKAARSHNKRMAKAVFCLVNKERRRHHLRPLHRQRQQSKAARAHNRRMVRDRCFSHRCPGEPDLTGRLTRTGYLPCNCSWGIAENIGYGSGGAGSPRGIVSAWMHSPEHRAILLSPRYHLVGIGRVYGNFLGHAGASVWTVDWGHR